VPIRSRRSATPSERALERELEAAQRRRESKPNLLLLCDELRAFIETLPAGPHREQLRDELLGLGILLGGIGPDVMEGDAQSFRAQLGMPLPRTV
jgi:hypothetical protein